MTATSGLAHIVSTINYSLLAMRSHVYKLFYNKPPSNEPDVKHRASTATSGIARTALSAAAKRDLSPDLTREIRSIATTITRPTPLAPPIDAKAAKADARLSYPPPTRSVADHSIDIFSQFALQPFASNKALRIAVVALVSAEKAKMDNESALYDQEEAKLKISGDEFITDNNVLMDKISTQRVQISILGNQAKQTRAETPAIAESASASAALAKNDNEIAASVSKAAFDLANKQNLSGRIYKYAWFSAIAVAAAVVGVVYKFWPSSTVQPSPPPTNPNPTRSPSGH